MTGKRFIASTGAGVLICALLLAMSGQRSGSILGAAGAPAAVAQDRLIDDTAVPG